MNPAVKYGIIVLAWLIYLSIGFSGKARREAEEEAAQNADVSTVECLVDMIV